MAVLLLMVPACAWRSGNERVHLVFGFGIIKTAESASPASGPTGTRPVALTSAHVERVEATGVFLGPGAVVNGFMIGRSVRQSVAVGPESDALADVVSYEDGKFNVRIMSLTQPGSEEAR